MLNRRKPGQSNLTSKRNESDTVKILSGLENGVTLGTPIGFIIPNQDVIKKDYSQFNTVPRPGHADLTYLMKYGIKAESGGGFIISLCSIY
jgi:chorismate synthase